MEITANGENQEKTCQPSRTDIFSKSNIDECERYVLSIQRRLDKAVANGDRPRIKWYSHTLAKRSRTVKVLAVHRVCKVNQGRHTAGVDGVRVPYDKGKAKVMMLNFIEDTDITKKPDPIRRTYIPKPNGDKRPLGIPTIADRINQDIIRQAIEPICEFHFNPQSYGFRPKRSCQDVVEDLFTKLSRKSGKRWIVEGDIKGCFDHIKHDHILSTLAKWNVAKGTREVIGRMLKSGIMSEGVITNSTEGTPQGGIISPLLANVALTHLDDTLEACTKGRLNPIVRYADDFVIIAQTKEQAEEIKSLTKTILKDKAGLDLSAEKTRITEISKGFDFLGFNFRKYGDKMLIKPSKANILRLKEKVSDTVKGLTNTQSVVAMLRPIIYGWGNYYRHSVAKRSFNDLDDYIWQCAWIWALKRHPKGSRKSIAIRYFQRDKGGWNFIGKDAESRIVKLSDIPIKRFIKVRKDTRVYDVNAIDYWKERGYLKARISIHTSKSVNVLFTKQKGRCAYCHDNIKEHDIKGSNIHQHHLKPRSEGGDWKSGNLRLLHADCHTSLHSTYSRKEMADLIDKGIDYLRLMRRAK